MVPLYLKFCNYMTKINEDFIRRQLQKHTISYDESMIKETYLFMDKFIGLLNNEDARFQIAAACAIICQTIKIPTVDHLNFTSSGIKIENVMRHIGNLSKQTFLETIQNQLKKSHFSNHSLIEKVGNIKIAFRVFKKYKNIFQKLSLLNKFPNDINNELLSFFWMIFLIVKHNLLALQDLNLSIKILAILIQQVFCKYLGRSQMKNVSNYIRQKDNFSQLCIITQQQQVNIKNQIQKVFLDTLKNRDQNASPKRNHLIQNSVFLSRLLDDLNSHYNKLYLTLPQGRFIDQSTFLELTKNLTPQAITIKNNQKPITKVLDFSNDDDDSMSDNQNNNQDDDSMDHPKTEQKKPNYFTDIRGENTQAKSYQKKPQKTKQWLDCTPVSLGSTKYAWAQNFIAGYQDVVEPSVREYYDSKNIFFEDFQDKLKKKVSALIQEYIVYAINKQKNITQSLKMYFTFVHLLNSKYKQLNLANDKVANSLLCVSTCLYNQTIRFLTIELEKYCLVFQGDLLQCLKILQLTLQINDLPNIIHNILLGLQKQVLIKQLWNTSRGYQLLLEGKNPDNQIIFTRLHRRIYQRIKQICQVIKVSFVQVDKIEALVNQILSNKLDIIRKSKLDQIIICSICACLNLNQTKYNLALNNIFQKYNQMPSSHHSYRQINIQSQPGEGPKTLLEFYNKVFIQQVQNMMSQQDNPKYLYTPIRQNHIKIMKQSSEIKAEGFKIKGLGSQEWAKAYQRGLFQKMKSSSKPQTKNQKQEQNSPYFGERVPRLKTQFSFGNN